MYRNISFCTVESQNNEHIGTASIVRYWEVHHVSFSGRFRCFNCTIASAFYAEYYDGNGVWQKMSSGVLCLHASQDLNTEPHLSV